MAPPPGIVEVRCAGCGETLEVEPGLTEFACPDCGAHQALPPELMPRRPRRALPIPRRCTPRPAAPSRVACGGCGAVLSAPHGQGRFACPLCGSELAASQVAAISVVAPPAAVPITPSRPAEPSQVHPGPSSQSTHVGHIQKPIHSEQTHGQRPRHSFREEPFTLSKADTGIEIPVVGRLQNEPANPSSRREESHTEPLDGTISRPSKKKSRFVAGPDSYPAGKAHEDHLNQAVYASEGQGMPSKSSVRTDKVGDRFPNGTVTVHRKQKVGSVVVPSTIEQDRTKSLNQAVDEQQAGEIPNDMIQANKVQVDFVGEAGNSSKRNAKDRRGNLINKSKILMNSSNELPRFRHSERLVKVSHDLVDVDPIEKIDASLNRNLSVVPEIERADSDHSSPARYRFPHGDSNEWDGVDATTPPALNRGSGTQHHDQFPRTQMYSPESRWALPVANSNSWHECPEIPQESFSGVSQLDRGYAEVCSNPAEMQDQDMDGQPAQEACIGKNCLGQIRLEPHNQNLSDIGRQERNGFTGSSSNVGAHFSGTCHQNLSASCSCLAASLPSLAATTLPTITSPSSDPPLNCSSPTLLHQQPPSPFCSQFQDAPCDNVLPGPISNSSKKRRGRAPEKLMEPRKEADRPVLTPRGTDWSVHPPCPKVASTLSCLIKLNYPGVFVSDGTSGNGQSCEHVVYHWHQCPPDTKATILDEFLKRYKWSPGHEEECQKILDRKAVRQLVNLFCHEKQRVRQVLATKKAKKSSTVRRACAEMEQEVDGGKEDSGDQQGDESVVVLDHENPLKWKPFVPAWMKPKWWEMLCDHWARDEVMKLSYQQRKNRYSGKRPSDASGSQKITLHEQLVGSDNGGKLAIDIDSPAEISRESVGERACQTEDTRDQPNKEAKCTQPGSHFVQRQVGVGKHGRSCGAFGISKKAQHESLSESSPICVSTQGQQPMFTKEQVQEMINQALQGLNEAWEKKFLSLEQKMPSMSSSHIIPNNGVKKSSLAVGRSKRCNLSQQDPLASMDEGDDDDDDDDYQVEDEEEHSS